MYAIRSYYAVLIVASSTETIDTIVCEQLIINDSIYTASGTYIQNLINEAGCDSTLTINLTINQSSSGTETHDGCEGDGYEVTVNGTLYNEANPTGTEVRNNFV